MNYKRIGRVLVCLLLVCCLLVRVSPIQAKAATLAGTVAAGTAIAAGLVALGIGVGATETAFNNLVDSLTAIAGSDRVPVWISETADGFVTYLQESFLGSLLAHCFDTGVLVSGISVPADVPANVSSWLATAENYKYSFFLISSTEYIVGYNNSSPYIAGPVGSSGPGIVTVSGASFHYCSSASNRCGYSSYIIRDVSNVQFFGTAVCDPISTDEDLTLGSVGATMSSPNYDPWRTAAIPVVPPVVGGGTADEEDALPVTFPGLDTPSITGQTQAEARAGTTAEEIVDVMLGVQFEEDATTPTEPDDIPGAGAVTATLLERLFSGVQEKLDLTYTSIQEIPELLKEFMLDVKTGFSELLTKFAEWFNNIQTSLELLVSGQLTIGQLLGEFLSPLIDAFKSLLQSLFAPSSDFIETKVEALIAKYTYLEPMLTLGDQLKVYFAGLGTEPPIIYIDLGAATGSYYFGGRTVFVDLTWYERYKPTMDAIIAGFLWLWVAWRLFQSVPGIIQGLSGIWGTPESVPDATFHNPKYQVGKNWLNSGSSYHRKGDRGE